MQVLSLEAETAMLFALELWPNTTAVIAARCCESERRGPRIGPSLYSLTDDAENDSSPGIDHTLIVESGEPDNKKLAVGSTARHVVACR